MVKKMTVKQLKKACSNNKYILARSVRGDLYGINCGIAPIALRRKNYNDNQKVNYVSYKPCDFNTYISYKEPFIILPKV